MITWALVLAMSASVCACSKTTRPGKVQQDSSPSKPETQNADLTDPYDPDSDPTNTTPTAERYFRKLNEEYQKGVIDEGFATMIYCFSTPPVRHLAFSKFPIEEKKPQAL